MKPGYRPLREILVFICPLDPPLLTFFLKGAETTNVIILTKCFVKINYGADESISSYEAERETLKF